jgi:two-component system response regulator HydG
MLKSHGLSHTVLLVDDEEISSNMVVLTLRQAGIQDVTTLTDSRLVTRFLDENRVALVLLDLHMPHLSGLELLSIIRRDYTDVPVVIVTGSNELETALECMKLGALDYLVKPVESNRLVTCVKNVQNTIELQGEVAALKRHLLNDVLEKPGVFSAIITCSKKMRAIFQYIEVVAPTRQTILITGETGVGKELIAGAVHHASRVKGEFVVVNVAGLDDAMFSDTLFGHKKGAFTGAESARDGLISCAAGGTLFLDEIGDLSEASQIKLLRLLQQNEYYPAGSDIPKKSTARIVVATNVDLEKKIAEGKFRRDLFYRLCTHQIIVPPLRQRTEDIHLLACHFVEEASRLYRKKNMVPIHPDAIGFLKMCPFHGNVRELQAVINDAVARHTSGFLVPKDFILPSGCPQGSERSGMQMNNGDTVTFAALFGHFPTSREIEERHLDEALELAKGNHNNAAVLLGITRKTIANRLNARKQN